MIGVGVVFFVVACGLLVGLLIGEKRENPRLTLAFKTPLSCLFVVTAVLLPHPLAWYYHYILAGLVLGLAGDVFLAIPGKTTFRAGLAAFLAGHVLYVVAFAGLTTAGHWATPVHVVIIVISVAVFLWLRPHLGDMLVPVVLYVIVITAMLSAAWVASSGPHVPAAGSWAILVGAAAFYVSDLFVARDRFVRHGFVNRLVGLPLYYCGQFLIALSTGLVG
ncbi:MAG: lysoplasmalogenase [Desulfomonilaceae bacterium]|nr:lysoplasmalogenase [Desulfomonilaceae bacterium]